MVDLRLCARVRSRRGRRRRHPDAIRVEPDPRQPVGVLPAQGHRGALLLRYRGTGAEPAQLRRHARRPDPSQPDVLLRRLRRPASQEPVLVPGLGAATRSNPSAPERRRRPVASRRSEHGPDDSDLRSRLLCHEQFSQQFPGNVIPAARVSRAGLAVLQQLFPAPNRPGTLNGWLSNFGVNQAVPAAHRHGRRPDRSCLSRRGSPGGRLPLEQL